MMLSWLMVKWRPSLPRRDAQVGSMIAFGGNVAASYFIITVSRSADNVLIGRYIRSRSAGAVFEGVQSADAARAPTQRAGSQCRCPRLQ